MQISILHGKRDMRLEQREMPQPSDGEVLVQFGVGGICGSDLHYYFEAANGAFVVQHPFVIGHEMAGIVAAVGDGIDGVAVGDRVAVNPGIACGQCAACRHGRENLCRDMIFWGSASTMPHTEGAFQEYVVVQARQVHRLPDDFDLALAALAEPLAVSLHALNRAGSLIGKSVLITGAGTIGSLILLAAKTLGAVDVTMTDVLDERLQRARQCGADTVINVASDSPAQWALLNGELQYDVVLEASGDVRALQTALYSVVKGGTMVQVGFSSAGEVPLNINHLLTHEINFLGTYRFAMEFDHAVAYLVHERIDARPLITHTYPFARVDEAFNMAADGAQSMKVQLVFED
ncbi:MAG: L-idonate 5-dehydrogenase [Chloroflexi bacterium]|nr:MAG: L-idonate 5-dehydrogenase [Chloroflexota bacterium]